MFSALVEDINEEENLPDKRQVHFRAVSLACL